MTFTDTSRPWVLLDSNDEVVARFYTSEEAYEATYEGYEDCEVFYENS